MAIQNLRSSTANKRPDPTQMVNGQLAINLENSSPGLFFKDDNGDLVKVGPAHVDPIAPNASPAGTTGNAKTPSSASDTGTEGEISWDTNYIYVCVATDTWKRVALSTW